MLRLVLKNNLFYLLKLDKINNSNNWKLLLPNSDKEKIHG